MKLVGWYGCLEVHELSDTKLRLSYAGNMGNSLQRSVKPCVDAVFKEKGLFDKLLPHITNQKGSPDYYWSGELKKETLAKLRKKK